MAGRNRASSGNPHVHELRWEMGSGGDGGGGGLVMVAVVVEVTVVVEFGLG